MFGYKLVPAKLLDYLLDNATRCPCQAAPSPVGVTVTHGSAITTATVPPATSGAVPEPLLPPEVAAAVVVWKGAEAQVSAQAREWLEAGMSPREVARRVAQGDPVDD